MLRLPATDKTLLLDALLKQELGEGLNDVVTQLRASGLGVRAIAERLTDYTGVQVSYRTVARWVSGLVWEKAA